MQQRSFYFVFEYANLPPLMTVVPQHHPDPWLPAALGRLGIGVHLRPQREGGGRARGRAPIEGDHGPGRGRAGRDPLARHRDRRDGDQLPSESQRRALFAELAERVEAAQAFEERAVELLKA